VIPPVGSPPNDILTQGINGNQGAFQSVGSREGAERVNLKNIIAGAAISAALGFTALGVGVGVANANPAAPGAAGTPWQQDRGHSEVRDGGGPGAQGDGSGPDCFFGPFGHIYCL